MYHYANIKNSKRLQKVFEHILNNPLCTNWDVMKATGSTRVPSDVSEINKNFMSMDSDLYIEDIPRTINDKRVTGWMLTSCNEFYDKTKAGREMLKSWQDSAIAVPK